MQSQRHQYRAYDTAIRWIGWAVSLLFLAVLLPNNSLAEENFGEGAEIEVVFQAIQRSEPLESQPQANDDPFAFQVASPCSTRCTGEFRDELVVWKSGIRNFINGCGADLRL